MVQKLKQESTEKRLDYRVNMKALELVVLDVVNRLELNELQDIFNDVGIPCKLTTKNFNTKRVLSVVRPFTTEVKILYFLKFVERVTHPLAFNGSEKKSKGKEKQYNSYLKFDNIALLDGKAYFGPTQDEITQGREDWFDSDFVLIEPTATSVMPSLDNYFHITKRDDFFYYHKKKLDLNYRDQYVKAFAVLYNLLPKGGFCTFQAYENAFKKTYRKITPGLKLVILNFVTGHGAIY